jgi:hypothetical protein
MRKIILLVAILVLFPALVFAQSGSAYIISNGDGSSTYVTSTGESGQIRYYPGDVAVISPYQQDALADTKILLNNFHQSVQNLSQNDGLRSLRQKHVPGFIEDD